MINIMLFKNKRARHIILTHWTGIELVRLRELKLSFMKPSFSPIDLLGYFKTGFGL